MLSLIGLQQEELGRLQSKESQKVDTTMTEHAPTHSVGKAVRNSNSFIHCW